MTKQQMLERINYLEWQVHHRDAQLTEYREKIDSQEKMLVATARDIQKAARLLFQQRFWRYERTRLRMLVQRWRLIDQILKLGGNQNGISEILGVSVTSVRQYIQKGKLLSEIDL